MVFLKENLIKCVKTTKPEGFELEYHTGIINFINSNSLSENRIGITFACYFPHSITFTGISSSITYKAIEDILLQKSKDLRLDYSSASSFRSSSESNSSGYSIVDKKIESEDDFVNVQPNIEYIINNDCLPFFEKYQDLYNVAELLSSLKPQEVVPYIQGAKLFCKTILILREANHPKFDEKRDEFYEVLKKQATKKAVYKEQLKLFENLFY